MSSQNIRKMVTTAILIALTIVFQLMRPILGGSNIISTYIIGSLVNLALIVAACAVGLWSGVAVSVITPIIALMQGHATLPMVPWVMGGNLVLVIIFALFAQKDKASLQIEWVRFVIVGVFATMVKYIVISIGQALVLTSAKGLAFGVASGTAFAAQIVQIVTALIGTVLAGIILPMLPASVVGKKA
ncbi:MAG: ECF transporter S component [Eubacteriales bacterium]|nr:ECF transporter S component [Eubacteriales bacterium]